jgi:predicted Fe-Mo cluster-binding NifX family protein
VVSSLGVGAVIAGNYGPNAYRALSAAGLRAYTGASGTVREAVEQFNNDQLQEVGAPTVAGHFGMSAAAGTPTAPTAGAGFGPGMGMGGGGPGMGGGGGQRMRHGRGGR